MSKGWALLPALWLRTTGFPFRHLFEVRLTDTLPFLQELEQSQADLDRLAHQFWTNLHGRLRPNVPTRKLDRIRRCVRTRCPLDEPEEAAVCQLDAASAWTSSWQAAAVRSAELNRQAQQVFEEELLACRSRLWSLAAQAGVQEAIFMSSPTAYTNLDVQANAPCPPVRNNAVRKAERRLYSYLQRLCAKNDTVGFYGPVNFGELQPQSRDNIRVAFTENRQLGRREVAFSHWGTELLARAIGADPKVQPHLPVRPSPLVRRVAPHTYFFHVLERQVKLPQQFDQLLMAISQTQTTASALAAKAHLPMDSLLNHLRMMARNRLVEWGFALHPCLPQPLYSLQHQVQGLPPEVAAPWLQLLNEIEQYRCAFAAGNLTDRSLWLQQLEALVTSTTGQQAQRKAGQGYADRLLLTEDCRGDVATLVIGGRLAYDLRQMTDKLFPFLLAAGQALRADLQAAIRPLWARLAADSGRVHYTRLLQAIQEAGLTANPGCHLLALQDLATRLFQPDADGSACASGDQLQQLATRYIEPAGGRPDSLVMPSLDFMIAAPSQAHVERGDFTLVLGEIHDDASTIYGGYLSSLHSDPAGLHTDLRTHLQSRPGWDRMAFVISNRRHKHYGPELPGYTVELAALSAKPREWVIPIANVEVIDRDGELTLVAGDTPLYLWPGDVHDPGFLAFALPSVRQLPLDFGPHTPRLRIDRLVYQRERWRVPADEWLPPAQARQGLALVRHMRGLQRRYGIPNWVFVRYALKAKPILVDFSNYFALEQLIRYVTPGQLLIFTEMLPGPDELWWPGPGGVQTCEFRIAVAPAAPPAMISSDRASVPGASDRDKVG